MNSRNKHGENRSNQRERDELYSRFYNDDNGTYNGYEPRAHRREDYVPYLTPQQQGSSRNFREEENNQPPQRQYEGRYAWYDEQDQSRHRRGNSMNTSYREQSPEYNSNPNSDYNYGRSGHGSFSNGNDMNFNDRSGRGIYDDKRSVSQRTGDRIRDSWKEWRDNSQDNSNERRNPNYDSYDNFYRKDGQRNTYGQNGYEEGEAY